MPRHTTTLPTVAHPVPIEADARPFQDMPIDSMEVAESVGKAHSHVLRDIRRIITDLEKAEPGSGQSKFGLTSYPDDQGKMRPCYRMSKNGLLVLASGYSSPLRAKLVDRLEHLERAAANPVEPEAPALKVPTNMREALLLALEQNDQIEAQKAQLALQAPKVAALEQLTGSGGSLSLTDAAKVLGLMRKDALVWLSVNDWIFPGSDMKWRANADKVAAGLLEQIVQKFGPDDRYATVSVRITVAGMAELDGLIDRALFVKVKRTRTKKVTAPAEDGALLTELEDEAPAVFPWEVP